MKNDSLITTLFQKQLSQRQIARVLKVSQPFICKRLRVLGLTLSAPSPHTAATPAPLLANTEADNQQREDIPTWDMLPLNALLAAAFQGGARVELAEEQIALRLPSTLPPELRDSLCTHGPALTRLLERAAVLHSACPCGNLLWWQSQDGPRCATCTPPPREARVLTWFWCEE
jgi:hypothetical protein